jgi:polyketide synthase 5
MVVRNRTVGPPDGGGLSADDQPRDNRLALLDHAFFRGQRATGQDQVIQVVWVYEHPINLEGLRRFHHNLGKGLLGRRIERSPLPFARHRWVSAQEPVDIAIAENARPRDELSDWADERSQLPADPEVGPGWHLGVLPLTDGSTAISLVVSHYLLDGLGLISVLADAVQGNTRDLGLPPPRSRTRLRAALQDVRQTAQEAPEAARALAAVAKLARRHRHDLAAAAETARHHRNDREQTPAAPCSRHEDDEVVTVPGITIHIPLKEWDTCAEALDGTSKALFAGLAAKLGEHFGRRRAGDGAVTLQLPISDRYEGDTRANAMSFARVIIDPAKVTSDLSDARAAIRQALGTLRGAPESALHLHWLTQFAPKRLLKRLSEVMVVGDVDLPVFCSNLGDLGTVLCRLDGTDAEYTSARAIGQHVTRGWLEQTGGLMRMQGWRIGDNMCITVVAYRPGGANTKSALRELAARTLAEFKLTGEID